MLDPQQHALLSQHVVVCRAVPDAPLTTLRGMLDRDSFACVRGLVGPRDVARAIEAWHARFDSAGDRALDPGRPQQVRQNFQCVFDRRDDRSPSGRPQLLRAFYNPLWDDDVLGLHEAFRTIARLRNALMGLPADFALDAPERGLWTASRIHHYPSGGGFMVAHQDQTFSSLTSEIGVAAYFQITLVMSRKGDDYRDGGAYFVWNDTRVFYEEEYQPGDLVIYDDRIVHGVQEIDPVEPLDLRSSRGRLAGFANLYRVL